MTADVWCSRCGDRGCSRCHGTPAENPAVIEHLPETGGKTTEQINRDLHRILDEIRKAQS